jgi:hypothetical protein
VSSRLRTLGLALLICASGRAAERDAPARPPHAKNADDRISLALSSRAGLVEAPFVTAAFPEVSGFAVVLSGSAAVHLSSIGWLRSTLPMSLVWLDFPAGAQVREAALGNLELGLEHPIALGPSARVQLRSAFLVPLAEHGSEAALLNNRALALGSALNGGKDAALMTPGVTGLRLGAGIEQRLPPFEFRASLDVPVLVRLFNASLPKEAETHPLGLQPAVDLKATWRLTTRFEASLGVDLISEPWRVQEPALARDRTRRLQAVVEPGLRLQLGPYVVLGWDANIPVGGNLGGDAWSVGMQSAVEF